MRSSRKQHAKFIKGKNTHLHSKAQAETEDSLQNSKGGSDTEVQVPYGQSGALSSFGGLGCISLSSNFRLVNIVIERGN